MFLWKLGLNDAKNESIFKWADGSNLTVTPNWKTSGEGKENAGEIKDCVETTFDGKLNVNECFRLFGFICEKNKGRKQSCLCYYISGCWCISSLNVIDIFSWKLITWFFFLLCIIDRFGNNAPN